MACFFTLDVENDKTEYKADKSFIKGQYLCLCLVIVLLEGVNWAIFATILAQDVKMLLQINLI